MFRPAATTAITGLRQQHHGKRKVGEFLFLYGLIKIACLTIPELLGIGSLYLSLAERACNHPTGPAGIRAIMRTIESFFLGGRACAENPFKYPSGLPTAFFELPAIQF